MSPCISPRRAVERKKKRTQPDTRTGGKQQASAQIVAAVFVSAGNSRNHSPTHDRVRVVQSLGWCPPLQRPEPVPRFGLTQVLWDIRELDDYGDAGPEGRCHKGASKGSQPCLYTGEVLSTGGK